MKNIQFRTAAIALVSGAFVLQPATLQAAPATGWDTKHPEATFVFNGKPVHPGCTVLNGKKSISLKDCTQPVTPMGKLQPIQHKGDSFYADERVSPEFSNGGAYYTYRVLASQGNTFILFLDWSGGGSGMFSALQQFTLDKDVLRLSKNIQPEGDRCDGEVALRGVTNGTIRYGVSLTPATLMKLAGVKKNHLGSSLSSCGGSREMEYDPASGTARMVAVKLDAQNGSSGNVCYDHMVAERQKARKAMLSPDELKNFGQDFVRNCQGKPKRH